jgi:hypothetical protein
MRLLLAAIAATLFLPACTTEEPERKPVPPQSSSSQIPWNRPVPGQGGGAFGALPQQPRR